MAPKREITNEDVLLAILSLRQELDELKGEQAAGPDLELLRRELRDLHDYIRRTKAEIASIKHPKASEDRIASATYELDAIVGATESATHAILQKSEEIERFAECIRDNVKDDLAINIADQISDATLRLFEACSFQDITGQRVTKVVRTLRYVEDRILSIIRIWGEEEFGLLPPPTRHASEDEESRLLNGPQLEHEGGTQEMVDKLFDRR